jgi:hypothetical protein
MERQILKKIEKEEHLENIKICSSPTLDLDLSCHQKSNLSGDTVPLKGYSFAETVLIKGYALF